MLDLLSVQFFFYVYPLRLQVAILLNPGMYIKSGTGNSMEYTTILLTTYGIYLPTQHEKNILEIDLNINITQ